MGDVAQVNSQSSIDSHPDEVYNFFKCQLTLLAKIVPQLCKDVKIVDGNLQYELFVFGEEITVMLKTEHTDADSRSIAFTVVDEDNNKKNLALMIKLTVNDGNINWSLQFVNSMNVSKDVTNYVKAVIDLVIKALDIYLQFSKLHEN